MWKGSMIGAWVALVLGGVAALGADPESRPLVIAPAGVSPDRRIVQLVGVEEAAEWKGVPLFVEETGLDGPAMGQARWEVRKAVTQERVAMVDMRLPPVFGGRGRAGTAQAPDGRPHGLRTSIGGEAATALDGLPDDEYVAGICDRWGAGIERGENQTRGEA